MTHKILAVLATMLLSSIAIALDDDKGRSGDIFKAMDADRDDRLTQNEVSGDPVLAQHFASLDKNSDGYLTKREYAAQGKAGKNDRKEQQQPRPYMQ